MRRIRVAVAGVAVAAAAVSFVPTAHAANVADDQGFCKRQGPSSCSGASECSKGHIGDLPKGQAKKC